MILSSPGKGLVLVTVTAAVLASCSRTPEVRVEPATSMELVLIPAGDFTMGSPADEPGHEPRETLHPVSIDHAFYMGRFEVTQREWRIVMGTEPSHFTGCDDCPVERVNYFDVLEFIDRLNSLSGETFRLPTEAEWEYACRAGTSTPFNTGTNLTAGQGNYDGRYPYPGFAPGVFRNRTTPVGTFEPNAFGLYDMHGNVWEWTSDWFCPYPPKGEEATACETGLKVIRGGSWVFDADSARCALRYTHRPIDLGFSIGFRVVLPASE